MQEDRFCFDNTVQNWILILIGAVCLVWLGAYMATVNHTCSSKTVLADSLAVLKELQLEESQKK